MLEALQHLQEPTEHPESHELWRSPSQQDVFLSTAVSRFKLLREQGVSGAAIIAHALRNRLAPLQKRPHPAWDFLGPRDPSRLRNTDMGDDALLEAMKKIFPPNVHYQLPAGVRPLCEDPQKVEILAEMPECNALGIVGRDDAGPQIAKAKSRKVKVPSSSGEEEETSESETESAGRSEVESARSEEDEEDDGVGSRSDDDDADRDAGDEEDVDEEEEAEGRASPMRPTARPAVAPNPGTSPRAPPVSVVGGEGGPEDMEVDAGAFVMAPRREELPQRQSPVKEPSFAISMMPLSPHGSSAGSAEMPESLGCKRPCG